MDEKNEKSSQPRIPSDIRVYFGVLAAAAIMSLVLWLVIRFL